MYKSWTLLLLHCCCIPLFSAVPILHILLPLLSHCNDARKCFKMPFIKYILNKARLMCTFFFIFSLDVVCFYCLFVSNKTIFSDIEMLSCLRNRTNEGEKTKGNETKINRDCENMIWHVKCARVCMRRRERIKQRYVKEFRIRRELRRNQIRFICITCT